MRSLVYVCVYEGEVIGKCCTSDTQACRVIHELLRVSHSKSRMTCRNIKTVTSQILFAFNWQVVWWCKKHCEVVIIDHTMSNKVHRDLSVQNSVTQDITHSFQEAKASKQMRNEIRWLNEKDHVTRWPCPCDLWAKPTGATHHLKWDMIGCFGVWCELATKRNKLI